MSDRCESCEHRRTHHAATGECWYSVTAPRPDTAIGCACREFITPASFGEALGEHRAYWRGFRAGQENTAVCDLAAWLLTLDDPEDVVGREARRTVTLTQIIERAREAIGGEPS